jgi:hypothetical protein
MRAILAAGLLLLGLFPALATDYGVPVEPPVVAAPVSPHRNAQAQKVAASRECFRGCQMQCKTQFLACGYQESGAECLSRTDFCDRACQRSCRTTWNPLLDWPRPFD